MPKPPADMDLLRSIYRNLDREAVLDEHPGLTSEALVEFFRRLSASMGGPNAVPREAPPAPESRRAPPAAGGRRLILHTDGGSRGNPGPAAFGLVLTDESGRLVTEKGVFLGQATCNEAEYGGLIAGLEEAQVHGATEVLIRSDSQLLVRQLNGDYKVKSQKLAPLFQRARHLLGEFAAWRAEHIPRELNARADALANEAMDRRA